MKRLDWFTAAACYAPGVLFLIEGSIGLGCLWIVAGNIYARMALKEAA